MASIYRRPPQSRDGIFWIAFNHPTTGQLTRRSLDTADRAKAARLCAHVEALCKAASPSAPRLPKNLRLIWAESPLSLNSPVQPNLALAVSSEGGKSLRRSDFSYSEESQPMPSIYPRPADAENPIYWVALYHPLTGAQIRKSLETRNREEAIRRVRRLEAFCTLVSTQMIEVPDPLLDAIGARDLPLAAPTPLPQPAVKRCRVEEALASLLKNMLAGNDADYLANTLSYSRKLFGSDMVKQLDPRPLKKETKRAAKPCDAGISALYLDEITSEKLADFLNVQGFSMDTCRHYKEFIRRLFNHALASGIYLPANPHAPNPAAGLSSFVNTERDIVVLSKEDENAQLAAIADDWRVMAGVRLLLGTGMRLHEALSVRIEDVFLEKRYLRLLKNRKSGSVVPLPRALRKGATLKRGERTIALESSLLESLPGHIERLRSENLEWLIPSPSGLRWNANDFGKRLKRLNVAAQVEFSAQHFRSTYATRRIAEGWPLRVLARQMGTSVRMLELHYGGYIPPEALKYCG